MAGEKGSVVLVQAALALTFVFGGGGGVGEFSFRAMYPSSIMGDVLLLVGLRAAVAAAEDSGATRADLRAIRTLLTTIFRKYKTEMQVG